MSQQKDSDPEEYKRLHSEKEAHLKRIQQLNEENSRLKAEAVRWGFMNDLSAEFLLSNIYDYLFSPHSDWFFSATTFSQPLLFSLSRTNNLTTSLQSQMQNLRDNLSKVTDERNTLKKEAETKNQELQEKVRTITQVKKIGRRYKTQYDELKVEHDKVRDQ